MDYTSAQLIPIVQGKVAVFNDYIYLIHSTNLSNYQTMLEESINMIPGFGETMYREILKQQHEEISHILRTLEIPKRHSRSIDFLGSALKFVAGTPDHDDYKLLLTNENILIENSNRQTKINSVLENRINEITNQLNGIKKFFSTDVNFVKNIAKTPFFEYLSNRNNLIINYLNNIVLSIVLAKNDLINPLILDEIDVENLIEVENLQSISISNLLLATKIKILQNATSIHYILKIPQITKFCQFLKLYPVSHLSTMVKLPTQQAAKCQDVTYPISNCVQTTNEQICQPFISSCLTELLNNNTASCDTQNSYHLPQLQLIDDGIMILNDVYPTTIEDKTKILVNGTFLIMFAESIKINQTTYNIKKNGTTIEAHPPKTVSLKVLDHENQLSLPYLHKLNIDNTNVIQSLTDEIDAHKTIWWSLSSILTVVIIAVLICCVIRYCCCKNYNNVTTEQMQSMIANLSHRSETAQT